MQNIDKLYLPISHFQHLEYQPILYDLCSRFSTYIYLPTIIKTNYRNIIESQIREIISSYPIKGFVISNICQFELIKNLSTNYELIGNYTLNIFNPYTVSCLQKLGISTVTLSPELNYDELVSLTDYINTKTELIVYGNLPVMTSKYCLLGKSNKCYPNCTQPCKENNKYYLKDRLNLKFRILPDNLQTITTIFNSKTTSIKFSDFNLDSVRIDILDENINEINKIIDTVKSGNKLEGNDFTNGNLNKRV